MPTESLDVVFQGAYGFAGRWAPLTLTADAVHHVSGISLFEDHVTLRAGLRVALVAEDLQDPRGLHSSELSWSRIMAANDLRPRPRRRRGQIRHAVRGRTGRDFETPTETLSEVVVDEQVGARPAAARRRRLDEQARLLGAGDLPRVDRVEDMGAGYPMLAAAVVLHGSYNLLAVLLQSWVVPS